MPSTGGGQEGVAYLLALVVLSLLTMLGIGLHLVVQTDGEAVASMREVVRLEFQARSGIALAVSRSLAYGDATSFSVDRPWREEGSGQLREVIEAPGLRVVRDVPCAYCSVEIGSAWSRRSHRLSVQAKKVLPLPPGDERKALSASYLDARIDFEPLPAEPCSAESLEDALGTESCGCRAPIGSGGGMTSRALVRWRSEQGEISVRCASFEVEELPEKGLSTLIIQIEDEVVGQYPLTGLVRHPPMLVDLDYDGILDRLYVGTVGGAVLRLEWDVEGAAGLGTLRVQTVFQSAGRPVLGPLRVATVGRSRRLAVVVSLGRSADAEGAVSGTESQRLVVVADDGWSADEPVVIDDLEELAWGLEGERDLLRDPAPGRRAGWWLEIDGEESILGVDVFGNGLLVVRTMIAGEGEGSGVSCEESPRVGFRRIFVRDGGGMEGERRTLWIDGCPGSPFWISQRRALVALPREALEDEVLRSGVSRLREMASSRCSFGSFSHVIVSQVEGAGLVALVEMPICVRQMDWNPTLAR